MEQAIIPDILVAIEITTIPVSLMECSMQLPRYV